MKLIYQTVLEIQTSPYIKCHPSTVQMITQIASFHPRVSYFGGKTPIQKILSIGNGTILTRYVLDRQN